MAETSLVVRDGNGNRNSSPTFLFSVWGHLRIPCVSKENMPHVGEKATTVREPGNQHDQFAVVVLEDETSVRICNHHSLQWVTCFSWSSRTSFCSLRWWFSARFPRYRKQSILRELVEVVCNTHFHLSSLSLLHLTLLLDSFYLIVCHISNVASQFLLFEFLFLHYIAQIIIFWATHN